MTRLHTYLTSLEDTTKVVPWQGAPFPLLLKNAAGRSGLVQRFRRVLLLLGFRIRWSLTATLPVEGLFYATVGS